uniref:Protein HGH1 homolog n=1 Tax=Trieres chinensis TaxID=1514140 RepID=A0A7S2ABG3_TRICV|mmetsp:Transcript_9129/g.19362  ORF Transcript_9129/g.19362 Transcript_9129/m.19362 type:complete len:160 (+) Transcript_9129:2-481(+)
MVRRAATEAMSNLVPHPKMMEYLADPDKLKLWVAFASDFEENFECARAAAGCLAMASREQGVAAAMAGQKNFESMVRSLLECGNLELMHRVLVILLNMSDQGGKCKEVVVAAGAAKFCQGYVQSYHDGTALEDLDLSEAEMGLMATTVELAKEVVTMCG